MNENMIIQYLSFTFLISSISQISIGALLRIWKGVTPPAGTADISRSSPLYLRSISAFPACKRCYGQLFSTFIASYSYVNVIPSWANEMTPGVKVNYNRLDNNRNEYIQ